MNGRQRQSLMERLRGSLPANNKRGSTSSSSSEPKHLPSVPEKKKALIPRDAACRRSASTPTVFRAPSHRRTASAAPSSSASSHAATKKARPPLPAKLSSSNWARPATTIGIITALPSPTAPTSLIHVVEQQSIFIQEQQTIILKLIEQMERMDRLLQQQQQSRRKHRLSLQSDESASALDRIAEEIADTYEALRCESPVRPLCFQTQTGPTALERFHARNGEEEPESPVLPRVMAELTPPCSPAGRVEWCHAGGGRFYRCGEGAGGGEAEGGYI